MHRLALAVGRLDVDALGRELTWDEFRAWQAYCRVEPFGAPQADRRAAMLAMTASEPHRDRKLHPRPFQLSDFMDMLNPHAALTRTGPARPMTEQQWQQAKRMALTLGKAGR